MAERELKLGDAVLTSSGERGRIIQAAANGFTIPRVYQRYDLEGQGDVIVYTVLLESGEVRRFSLEALAR